MLSLVEEGRPRPVSKPGEMGVGLVMAASARSSTTDVALDHRGGALRQTAGMVVARSCPCGSASYDGCCGPLLRGERQADSPEELMRSRYTAFAVGDGDHLWRTWHPRTRPEQVALDPRLRWTGLEVLEAVDDLVEFRAHHDGPDGPGVLHERSRFARRAGRWFYLDGEVGPPG
jgi:SEC-C motif-containing protein